MHAQSAAELVGLARAGNKEAFGELIARYHALVRRVATRMVADSELAQDLTQEALLQAYLSLDQLRDETRFVSWLYGITLNVCRSYLRDQKTMYFTHAALTGGLVVDALEFAGVELDPAQAAEERELHRVVLEAVNTLSPENRAAALLFYYQELSVQEVAAILDISVTAVKGRLHKARKQLRATLAAEVTIERRKEPMRKITLADVLKREQPGAQPGQTFTHYIVILLDEAGRRILPIWVGPWEGQMIAIGARENEYPRPLTFTFIVNLLQAAGASLEEVRVQSLQSDIFYAVAKLKIGDRVQEVDARPSDALALAVRTGAPLYAAEEVLERAGIPLPEQAKVQSATLGKGMEQIVQELLAQQQAALAHIGPSSPERMAQSQQEILAAVLG